MTTKSEREDQIDKINKKLDSLNGKLKSAAEEATNKSYDAKEDLAEKLNVAQAEMASLKDRYDAKMNSLKDKLSFTLAKAKAEHDELKQNIHDRREANDAKKLARYIDDTLEYSEDCAELSLLFAAESRVAVLEALLAMEEYDEKYGMDDGEEE